MADEDLLQRIDAYLHSVPLSGATPEEVGSFTLFRTFIAWPYYARPRPDDSPPSAADVQRLIERCRELDLPISIEWVREAAPAVESLALDAGMEVAMHPLLVLERGDFRPVPPPAGCTVGVVPADADLLAQAVAVAEVGFGAPGTAVGSAGAVARDSRLATPDEARIATLVDRTERGLTVTAVARSEADDVVASGAHQPVGSATEVVGVATLPAYRRRGLGAAVTSSLVEHALAIEGVDLVLLSADSDDVARVYERVGFRRVGHAGAAEFAPPASPDSVTIA